MSYFYCLMRPSLTTSKEHLQAGASMFLHKPVKPQDIVQAVNDVSKTDDKNAL
jgi:FixJ family two-component response regulator